MKIKKLRYILVGTLATTILTVAILGRVTLFSMLTHPETLGDQIEIYKKVITVFDVLKEAQNRILGQFYTPSGDLPVYRIEISNKNYAKLTEDLPNSGRKYVNGTLTTPDGTEHDVELKFRGENYWHWDYPKKSWRVKFDDPDKNPDNSELLNFINPRHKSQILYPLGYYLGEKAGLLTPKHEFIAVYVNGKYNGLYSKIEQIDQDFLENHDMPAGDIYYGEPEKRIKMDKEIGIFASTDLWELKPSPANQNNNKDALQKLIETIQKDPPEFKKEIQNIVDVDKMLRYIAIQDIAESNHVDNFRNLKIYLNPKTGLFEPIVWDLFAWLQIDSEFTFSYTNNLLFHKLQQIPEFNEIKNKYIWEFINSFASQEKMEKLINEQTTLIHHEIFFDPYKDYVDTMTLSPYIRRPLSNKGWKEEVELTKTWYPFRHNYLLKKVNEIKVDIYHVSTENDNILYVQITGECPVVITSQNKDFPITTLYPEIKIEKIPPEKTYKINKKAVTYTTTFQVTTNLETENIQFSNTITGKKIEPQIHQLKSIEDLQNIDTINFLKL